MTTPQRDRHLAETGALLAAWAVAIVIVNPRGNFPLHDDWDFAVATFRFAQTGEFHFTNFTAVSLRAMVLWGAAWVRLFGESFEVLRASTLTLSALAVALVHRTLVRAGAERWGRVAGTLALLAHPIFLWASCTYMTDVPFVCASAAAFYCFARALREERPAMFAAGTACVIAAWFIRQNGVFILAALVALLVIGRARVALRWRAFAAIAAAGIALFAALWLVKPEWLSGSPKMFAAHYHMWQESSFRLPEQCATLFHYLSFTAINLGFFFAPLAAAALALAWPRDWRAREVTIAIAAALVFRSGWLAFHGYLVPYESDRLFSDILPGPIVFDFGIGPALLIGRTVPFAMPYALRFALTFGVTLLAVSAVVALLRAARAANGTARLAAAWVAGGALVLFGSGYYYDRYSLDVAWPACVALALVIPWQLRGARVAAAATLLALALFSLLGVQEYFIWNRVRWAAFDALRARGIAIEQIDAGGEAFGFYELRDAPVSKARRGEAPRRYAIAFTAFPGYRVLETREFTSFAGAHRAAIYTLERVADR